MVIRYSTVIRIYMFIYVYRLFIPYLYIYIIAYVLQVNQEKTDGVVCACQTSPHGICHKVANTVRVASYLFIFVFMVSFRFLYFFFFHFFFSPNLSPYAILISFIYIYIYTHTDNAMRYVRNGRVQWQTNGRVHLTN